MKWSLGSVLYYPSTGEMKIPNMGIGIEGYQENNVETIDKEIDKDEDDSNSDEPPVKPSV